MGRLSALLLALVLGGVGAVALASCGGGSDAKLLPGAKANQIEANLDQVQQLVAGGDCIGAEDAVAAVSAEVEELNEVAAKLKAALQEGPRSWAKSSVAAKKKPPPKKRNLPANAMLKKKNW